MQPFFLPMNNFIIYLQLGIGHILNIAAIDHLLFILSFVAGMRIRDHKRALLLVTAFTIGHSVTLALATLQLVHINVNWIEFLIPVTIALSAFSLLLEKRKDAITLKFWIIALFGLIHGLGFSNYLQSLLGQEQSIIIPLIAFNLGVEVAQIFVVSILLGFMWILLDVLAIKRIIVLYTIIALILVFTIPMLIERMP